MLFVECVSLGTDTGTIKKRLITFFKDEKKTVKVDKVTQMPSR